MKISKADIVWNYLGYILRFFSGVLLLPVLLHYLTSEELGVWYVFLAIGSLTQLLDMGFSPTITRNVSYAYAGASNLQAKGVTSQNSDTANYILLAKIKAISQKIYLYISVAAIGVLLIFGTLYINYITQGFTDNKYLLVAWGLYSIGLFLNFYYSYWIFILNGVGMIKEGQQAAVISQSAYLVIAVFGLLFGGSIIAVSAASLLNGVLLRKLCRCFFEKHISLPHVYITKEEMNNLFHTIWFNAKKMAIVSVGAYLITQANTIIASFFFDLTVVAEYGLTLQIISVLRALAQVPISTYLPMFNELRVKNNIHRIIELMSTTFVIGTLIYIVGSLFIIFAGDYILFIFHSKTKLLNFDMTGFMLIYLYLEYNHSNFATIITTNNEVPFVKASIYSGCAVVLLALFNIQIIRLGLWGLLMAQFIAQIAYNNWYWPWAVCKDFNINPLTMICIAWKKFYIDKDKG